MIKTFNNMMVNQTKIYPCYPNADKITILNHFENLVCTGDFLPKHPSVMGEHIKKRTRGVIGELNWIVSGIDDEEFSQIDCNRRKLLCKLNNLSDYLGCCIDAFLMGNVAKCHESINRLVFEYFKPRFINIDEGQSFYRMRKEKKAKGLSHDQMFHIPYNKIELTPNYRYSLSGYPCLYLGSNIQLCWKELGEPELSECFAAHFSNTVPLRLLDMTFPAEVQSENDILWIALILATSIHKSSESHPFITEYIISQSILHSLITQQPIRTFDGVVYTSSKYYINKESFAEYKDSFNYVFPPLNRGYRLDGYCEDLSRMFQNTHGMLFPTDNIFTDVEGKLKMMSFPQKLSGISKPIYKDYTVLDKNPFIICG